MKSASSARARLQQPVELDLAVAHHARIGRAAREIFRNEIADDACAEIGAQIDNIKRKTHPLGNPPRILEIIVRAASSATLRRLRRRIGREAHRDADDLVALLA